MILITTSYDCDIQRTQELAYCRKQNHKEFWRIFLLYEQIAGADTTTRVWRRQTIADAFDTKFDTRIPDGEAVATPTPTVELDSPPPAACKLEFMQDEFWCLAKRPHFSLADRLRDRTEPPLTDANHSQMPGHWCRRSQYWARCCSLAREAGKPVKMGVDNRLATWAATLAAGVHPANLAAVRGHCHDNYVPKPLTTRRRKYFAGELEAAMNVWTMITALPGIMETDSSRKPSQTGSAGLPRT